ncbi:MAG: DinB family protein [Chloroflexi bacterium]|nr:DinB family protein [Chloroflexota bacterium]
MDNDQIEAALSLIAATPGIVTAIVEALPPEFAESTNLTGEWGPRDLVAHLLDVEYVAFVSQIRRVVEEDRPYITSIDPSRRIAESGYGARSVAALLLELRGCRERDVTWLRSLDRAALHRLGVHDEAGEVSASNFLHYWVSHDMTHICQLAAMTRSSFEPYVGPMKMFYEEVWRLSRARRHRPLRNRCLALASPRAGHAPSILRRRFRREVRAMFFRRRWFFRPALIPRRPFLRRRLFRRRF